MSPRNAPSAWPAGRTRKDGHARGLATRAPVLRLDDERDDHRPAAELRVDPAADRAADDLRQRVRVADAGLRGLGERRGDLRLDAVEHRVVLGEAARVDLRARDDPAGRGVHHDEDRDEALLAEDAAVLEVGIRDLADGRAVDVDEAEVELADDLARRRR